LSPPLGPLRSAPALGHRKPQPRELPALAWRALLRHRRVAGAGCAALAAAIGLGSLAPSRPPTLQVVAAAHDVATGTVLKPDDVRWVTLPADAEPTGAFTAISDVVGRAAASPIRSGEPITDVRLDGGNRANRMGGTPLAPPGNGLVAMPVRFADVEAASLLSAGEYVDVLAATPSSGTASTPTTSSALAAVVASDVRIISAPIAGAGTNNGDHPDDVGSSLESVTGDGALVVLATTPEQARALAQAEIAARLSAVVVR
jgi:Flp pilus assembly protein CpaB